MIAACVDGDGPAPFGHVAGVGARRLGPVTMRRVGRGAPVRCVSGETAVRCQVGKAADRRPRWPALERLAALAGTGLCLQ